MGGLVYDTGALLAAARGKAAMWRLHRGALERNEVPLVLAPILSAAWAGVASDRESRLLAALLRGCALADFPVSAAYDVGRLLALAQSASVARPGSPARAADVARAADLARAADVVAAAVVLAAVTTRSAVVTTDAPPLEGLAKILGVHLAIAAL